MKGLWFLVQFKWLNLTLTFKCWKGLIVSLNFEKERTVFLVMCGQPVTVYVALTWRLVSQENVFEMGSTNLSQKSNFTGDSY